MDPNANLEEQLRLANRLLSGRPASQRASRLDAARLAELVLALNEWIKKGGFLPDIWVRQRSNESGTWKRSEE